MRVRRSVSFTLLFQPRAALDVPAMLRGSLDIAVEDRLVATSMLTCETSPLTDAELRLLAEAPSGSWEPAADLARRVDVGAETVDRLLRSGLLIGDGDEPAIRELREREERLLSTHWDDHAAQYHLMSRAENVDAWAGMPRAIEAAASTSSGTPSDQPGAQPGNVVERFRGYAQMTTHLAQGLQAIAACFGPAPHHFHEVPDALARRDLPLPAASNGLFDLLRRRKTTRIFDPHDPVTCDELSQLLYYTFGCQGYAPLIDGVVGLRKTSPSGGALHPIEAYPLVLNVDGLETGLYHYSVKRHALDLTRRLSRVQAEQLAETFTVGQSYFRTAHVLVILTARFYRNFWKYRKAQKSYRVIHVDAGHLSQTFYLVATELGLGAFYTGAINDVNIEQALGIDGIEEGVVGISGAGRPWRRGSALTFETLSYVPRETDI